MARGERLFCGVRWLEEMQKDPREAGLFTFVVSGRAGEEANAADGRSRAVEARVLTAVVAAAELALTVVAGEPVSIRVGEMAGTGAEELVAP